MNKTNDETSIKIVLVEDFEMDREQILKILVGAGYSSNNVHVAVNRTDAEVLIETMRPQVVITDLKIPFDAQTSQEEYLENGLSLVRQIVKQYNGAIRVIAVSRFPYSWVIFQILLAGVSMVDKHHYKELPWVIQRVLEEHVIYTSGLSSLLSQACRSAVRLELEEIDVQILDLISKKITDREIAEKLNYDENTIGKRLKKIYSITGIHDRFQLSSWYKQFIAPLKE